MSTTYTVRGAGTGIEAMTNPITLKEFDVSEWSLVSEVHDGKKGLFTGTYHLNGTGKEYPVHLVVHSTRDGNSTYNKLELQTWVEEYDTVAETITYHPQTLFVAHKHHGLVQEAVIDVIFLLSAMFSVAVNDSVGAPWTGNSIRKLNDGNVDVLNDVFTDTAT